MTRSPGRRKILLLVVAVLATLFLLEIALRTYDRIQGHSFFNTAGNVLREPFREVKPFRTFGFDPYDEIDGNTGISDRWDRRFPLDKPAGTFRIVCFGGSTTAKRVEDLHYPGLLQDELRRRLDTDHIEVINAGNSAYATPHSLILLELDVISWQPDLVILSHNINDLIVMYWPGFRMDYWNKYSHEFYSTPDYSERYSWNNVVFQHSRLYWFVSSRLEKLRSDGRSKSTTLQRQPYSERQVREALQVFRRNVETFVDIAEAHDIPVLLGTQPLEPSEEFFLSHMAHKPYNDVVVYPPHDEFVRHHQIYNDTIRAVAAETGVGLVDNDAMFAGDPTYFTDHVHYTKAGLRKLAGNYADVIAGRYMPE